MGAGIVQEASRRFGDRLRDLRKNAGMTQQELADAIGGGQGTVARLELGDRMPSLAMLRRLAYALDVDVAGLLDEDSER